MNLRYDLSIKWEGHAGDCKVTTNSRNHHNYSANYSGKYLQRQPSQISNCTVVIKLLQSESQAQLKKQWRDYLVISAYWDNLLRASTEE